MGRHHRYVGPGAIRDRERGEPGVAVRSRADVESWLRGHPEAVAEGATFVVDRGGVLRLAPRRSEHIDCAGGEEVLAAGEIRFARVRGGGVEVAEVTNQSTGYCPDPDCWPAVAAALTAADVAAPAGFTCEFLFRRCEGCGQINIVKDGWFVCGGCDAELPRVWNFA
jgi:hypothetical protein